MEGVLLDEAKSILMTQMRGRSTSLTRGKTDVQKLRRFAQLPGADGLLLTCYGHDVWKGEVERIERNQWLDAIIVNVMLRHAKTTSGARNVHVLDTTFGKALLVPHSHADSRDELPLTAVNHQAAERFLHNLRLENYRLVLVPICNNVHWFLCALFPMRRIMAVICSLGNKYDDAAT
ncbi:hypothetical protein DPMN_106320 [Dreissena polymorpha]|uniref:Ubiquitin-like protease family profile domain-containing protein n=1 Tax=Dreissena polymorpha TaxID=45954 RepID=A0A9D4K4R8_DREPO|nr:hypothetical protein DPMN_106320 [Dreissena polymorpha]